MSLGYFLWVATVLAVVETCVVEEPSIVFGDSLGKLVGSANLLVCKVVAIYDCDIEPVLTLLSTTGEKVEITPFKKESYSYQPDEKLNYSRAAYFYRLEDIELDREYQWSIQATNQIGPYIFKYRDKDEYNRFDYFLLSNVDVSNKSLHLFKYMEATDWSQYDALILNGNAALNLEDSNGFVGDTFFKTLGPITSKIPFVIQAGDRDMIDRGQMLNYRFLMPGRSNNFGNNLFHITQGSSFMLFVNPNYFLLLNETERTTFITDLKSIVGKKTKIEWFITFFSGPYYCFDRDRGCVANYIEIKPVLDVLYSHHVSLIIHSQNGVYKTFVSSKDLSQKNAVEFNPHKPKYINGLSNTVEIVYGISGNAVQNLSNTTGNLSKEADESRPQNFSLPEESFVKLSIHQLALEVFLIDAKTNATVDSIAIFRPSISLVNKQQSSFVTFGLFVVSPIVLICLMMLPKVFNLRDIKPVAN